MLFIPLYGWMGLDGAMDEQEYGSQLLSEAVNALCKLPGVGKRTAMRYILSLQMRPIAEQQEFIQHSELHLGGATLPALQQLLR